MKIKSLKLVVFYCLGLILTFDAIAQNSPDHKTTAPVQLLPAKQDISLSGLDYESSKGWWALSCDPTDSICKITPSILEVSQSQFSPYGSHMDEESVPGQILHWVPSPPISTLFMFKPNPKSSLVKLVAGSIETYYYPVEGKDIFREIGSTESKLSLPNGVKAQLLPVMVLANSKDRSLAGHSNRRLTLELRIGAKRQTLINSGFSLFNQDYLAWAGDLDGDGKLDLLINTSDCGKNITLFLSSLAKTGELLGEAGRFEYLPTETGEC